ncbi:hypothetical protein ACD591_12580 [Rufibacter glacialis]|uniref:Uncharacterized protein n=1 Tax=Rufibacter glacialis TaxID=1259555 RepID=A0A5M8QPI2_9BACT|nr:hypothetical protein [Rufibacter glacialis]KAA6437198.1 hypothetical protein FOE74_01490 [Rufibacter glacialis]GGK61224.1 hypothetical protein GCM10011405_06740 [Rufibacter glacialis]
MITPTLPLQEKLRIFAGSLLLTVTIYLIIDLYVPAKMFFSGNAMSFSELLAHVQMHKKAPFIALITFLMARTTIKKRTKALAESQQVGQGPEEASQVAEKQA